VLGLAQPTVIMQPHGWKLPFNIAVAIHLLVILSAFFLPGMFKAKPKFADIYTVSLINIAEPSLAPPVAAPKAPAPPPAKQQEQPPTPPSPPKVKKLVPIAEPTPEVAEPVPAPVAPPKAISLKPLKQKVVKEVKQPEAPPKKDEQDLTKVKKLAQAIREEAILSERARLAQEAVEQERQVLAKSNVSKITPSQSESTSSSSTESSTAIMAGSSNNILESQYQAAIASRLQQFWSLPEYLQKDPNLTAIVAITIKVDGTIANVVFENKSGDRIFDQFVNKAIEEANPLPPIPPALKKQRYEIGFRFKPGSIQ
jgi:colicin import membrane protein